MSVQSGAPPRSKPAFLAVLLVTAGTTFLAFLDTTVVNVAFPALRAEFPATAVADLSWTVSAYAVLFAALLTPAGRLADLLGRRRLFLISVLGFVLASAAVSAAPNLGVIVAARALQGAFAAGMIPAGLAIVLAEAPPERRIQAVGLWGAAGSLAAAAGPSLGGVLVEYTDWRMVFLINVPIGGLLLLFAARVLRRDQPAEGRLPDLVGTIAVAVGIGSAVLGLTKGEDWGWASPATLGSIAGGVVLMAVALLRSRRHPAPAVEIGLWSNRTFAIANLTSLLAGTSMFAWMLAGPLFLTTVWGYSVLEAGLAVTPGAFTSAIAAVAISRRATPRAQGRFITLGMLAFGAVNLWWFVAIDGTERFWSLWLVGGAVGGAAMGAVLTGLSTAGAMSVPPVKFATGTGLNLMARQIGGAIGVGAVAAILAASGLAGPAGFRNVFLFCALAAAVCAAVSSTLYSKSRRSS